MTRLLCTLLAALCLFGSAAGQNEEADFNKGQAKKLNAFAKKAYDKGFPRQAKFIWLQVLKLYDIDDAEAHKGLGHVKVGSSWNPDPAVKYPTDDTGTGSDGSALFKQYESLKKEMGTAHRMQAQKYAKAGRTDRATHHWQKVLFWNNDDADAKKALEHREVGELSGTALEQTLYERSKLIEKVISEQTHQDYAVEKVENAKNAILDKAQVPYISVRSEHFLLHGDAEEEAKLIDTLKWAERALRIAQALFPWTIEPQRMRAEMAYFVAKDTYKQVLRANADKVPDLEWRLEHTSTCGVGGVLLAAVGDERTMFDAALRDVARQCAGFASDGYNEGIGHTFVGWVFNNNRLFSVDRKKQEGTVASEDDREYTSPDFDVWKTLNLELAWKSTGGVAANELPFCDAATFTNEQRIKAWSFCDYLMRRDPKLIRDMDQLALQFKQQRNRQPLEFSKQFDGAHDVSLEQLDKEWEDFWTEASPVLKAIQNNTPPLAAVSKGVEKWLEAFNAARKEVKAPPVTWSSNLSTRCHDHAQYLKQNKGERGIDKEHRQLAELGGTHVGQLFAEMAIVDTGAKVGSAKKIFEQWLDWPGYRDALVHSFLRTVGIYEEDGILVMNVVSGLGSPRSLSGGYTSYPIANATIRAKVPVAELGPELLELLAKNGHADLKEVGYPLTLHFGTGVQGNRHTYRCRLTGRDGAEIPGLILLDDGNNRRTTAPGMVTFYPLQPLPKGPAAMHWTWERDDGPQKLSVQFTVQ